LTSWHLGHPGDKRTHFVRPGLARMSDPREREVGAGGDGGNDRGELSAFSASDAGATGLLVRVDGLDTTDR
jgi:hypothetical protein